MVFVIEGRRTEVNESYFTIEENAALPRVASCGVRRGWYGAVVSEGLIGVADEEDVFGFEVGMDKV